MRAIASTLLLGAVSAAVAPHQQVLTDSKSQKEAWSKPFHNLQESLKSIPADLRATWDEVSMMFPESMDKSNFMAPPKPYTRRPDSKWDHIVKGADIQSVWVENAHGEKEREIDGKLENYNLRAKKVDPSKLGVDPDVKQYSGYLDDDEEDKHLFYCEQYTHHCSNGGQD